MYNYCLWDSLVVYSVGYTKRSWFFFRLSYVNAENNLPYVETNQNLPSGAWTVCTY
jgi:hypothetical protein